MKKPLFCIVIIILMLHVTFSHSQEPLFEPDRLKFYDNSNSVRCSGRIVSVGDSTSKVIRNCGEPIREAYLRKESIKVWIYWVGRSVYYMVFLGGQLKRIKSTGCWDGNPDCE